MWSHNTRFWHFFWCAACPAPHEGKLAAVLTLGGGAPKKQAEKGILALFHHLPPSGGGGCSRFGGFLAFLEGSSPKLCK